MAINYQYINDFEKSRENRIGASDVGWLIPHPIKQFESLAAYTDSKGVRHSCTAIDLYNIKKNNIKSESGFAADMGHFIEVKAISEFIKDNICPDVAFEFSRGYNLHKMEEEFLSHKAKKKIHVNPEPFNNTDFKHNTESIIDGSVSHADCIYIPDKFIKGKKESEIKFKKNGMTFDLSKPFIIEAKSANYFSVKARKKDQYSGYDIDLKTWQGLPLRTFFQVQFQMALYGIDKAYVSLIYNTNEKRFWEIKKVAKYQSDLLQLANYMKQCLDNNTIPKQIVMNSKDIQVLYPEVSKDFRELQNEELSEILEITKLYYQAYEQEKNWKRKKEDAQERMSLHLKDTETLKGVIDGSLQTICKWKYTGGGKRLMGLKEIGEREDGKKLLNYCNKNGLIKEGEKKRSPDVVIKRSEIEGVE